MVNSSYNGSSNYDEEANCGLSDETFIRIAQGVDNDVIQAKVMILLKILKPFNLKTSTRLTFDDIDESKLLMKKFQYFYLQHCYMCRINEQ